MSNTEIIEEKPKTRGGLFKWLLIVLIAVIIILFSIANSNNVELGLIYTKTEAPLTAIMIVCFLLGLILGLIFLLISNWKNSKIIKSKNKEISELESRLGFVNNKLDELYDERNEKS